MSEALEEGVVVVKEAGNVQELSLENRSQTTPVFLNAGDIVKGARPSELPIELPTVLETVINRRTATAMHLSLPPAILVRADRVIE